MNEISIDGKTYISSKRAAEITGYAKDYVGQLCREGHIDAKMVGRSWYVYEPSIRGHRFGVEAEALESSHESEEAPVPNADGLKHAHAGVAIAGAEANEADTDWQRPTYTAELPQELPEIRPAAAPLYEEPVIPAEQTLTDMQAAWREWFERKQEVLNTPELEAPEAMEARHEAEQEADEAVDEAEEDPEDDDDRYDEAVGHADTGFPVEEASEEELVPLHRLEDTAPSVAETWEMRSANDSFEVPIHAIEPLRQPEPLPARPIAPIAAMHDVQPPAVHRAPASLIGPMTHDARVIEERILPKSEAQAKQARRKQRSASHAPVIALLVAVSFISIAIALIGSGKADNYLKTLLPENPIFNFLVGNREYTSK